MLGTIFGVLVVWLLVSLGSLKKTEKFWSVGTFVFLTVAILFAVFDGDSTSGSLSQADMLRIVLGLAIGVVHCVFYKERILEESKYPMAAGVYCLCVSVFCVEAVAGIGRWLGGF